MTQRATPLPSYTPGSLVRCREREWVVLPSDDGNLLRLRPLGGNESEITGIYLPLSQALGIDPVTDAAFPPPDPAYVGDATAARLLRDAVRLTFRTGAGPFRALGHINTRPRPYQLVPLLMALRLNPVRLLIADDVGIGKTIEAGLIARELLDRGEVRRLAVLCPPHLCDQWARELAEKFALEPVIIRSGSIGQLERALPPGDSSVFEYYPVQVISIDFAKTERRRAGFLHGAADLVIVDEAHTAARSAATGGMQQRHALLRDLAADPTRHLLLLTATPHSGVEDAFRSLLELLDPAFAALDADHLSEPERRTLARHLVQRRRPDVQQWLGKDDTTPFPDRETREVTFLLADAPEYRKLFTDLLAFVQELVRDPSGGMTSWKRRVRYWTALALLRCVMSSPAAARATLAARLKKLGDSATTEEGDTSHLAQYVLDIGADDSSAEAGGGETVLDFEPTVVVEEGEPQLSNSERSRLQDFLKRAAKLTGADDPKLAKAEAEIRRLLQDDFHPIIYCRYIATAEYVAAELGKRLAKAWPDVQVLAVTGLNAEEEREARVAELETRPRRVLVATDCLSEGINLQAGFDAVLHYDLPWNPNRLEQREGRVDRFGQPAPIVRTVMLYGQDNPIDGIVLKVLLRKAKAIRNSLGIMVPVPVGSEAIAETLVRTLFEEGGTPLQLGFDALQPRFGVAELEAAWTRAADQERISRTRFAQHAIKPEEVAQELTESDRVLGSPATVAAFVQAACARLEAALVPATAGANAAETIWRLPLAPLRERLGPRLDQALGGGKLGAEVRLRFAPPVPQGVLLVGRTHPLVEALAEYLLEAAMAPGADPRPAARCGVIRTGAVTKRTRLLLLRLRLLIRTAGGPDLLAEELVVAAYTGSPESLNWLDEAAARRLLDSAEPAGPVADAVKTEELVQTLAWLPDLQPDLANLARDRAQLLEQAHRRVRQVAGVRLDRLTVEPKLPADVLGVYVLLPVPKGMAQ